MQKNFYYTILGVNPDASKEEIESQYKKLVGKYHPDSGTSNDEMFKLLTEAREVLTDDAKRKQYDKSQNDEHEYSGSTGRYGTDPKPQYDESDDTSQETSGFGLEIFLLGLDRAQITILQVLFTGFILKLLMDPTKINMYEVGSNLFMALIIGTIAAYILKSQQKFSIVNIIGSALSLIIPLIILVFGMAAIITFFKLSPKAEAMVSTIVFLIIPFLINLLNFMVILGLVRNKDYLGRVRRLTAYFGFLCSIVLLVACVAAAPPLYHYAYVSNTNAVNAQTRDKEREEYLSDMVKRDIPMSISGDSAITEGGMVANDSILSGKATYTVIQNNAKTKAEGTRYFNPFTYRIYDEAIDYIEFVTDKRMIQTDKEYYDYCVIQYVLYDKISGEYESSSCDSKNISIQITPKKEEYKSGYYVDGIALIADADLESFSTIDGYILVRVPKDYYEYELTIQFADSETFVVNVESYFNQ